jgi:ABC-type antimicrobial peptide transport system permease subunit
MSAQEPWTLDLLSFFIGFGVAIYLGYLIRQMQRRTVLMERREKSMTVYTEKTPRDVFAAASAAFVQWLGLLVLLLISIAVIGLSLWFALPK